MLGQKPTGGYDVAIEQVKSVSMAKPGTEAETGQVAVRYHVTEPGKDSFSTQALTYPMAIAELDGKRDETFQFINEVEPEELTADG